MLALLVLVNFAHAYSLFTDPDFLESNCRFRSATHPFASSITSRDQNHHRIDLDRDHCETELRLAILANVTDANGVTTMADAGTVEFREPNQSGAPGECAYTVQKGLKVPRLILEMNGTVAGRHQFWPEDILRIRHEVKRLVHVTCDALTS